MRRFLTYPLCIVLAGCSATMAKAAPSIGASACSAFAAATNPTQQALYLNYLQGFANASSPDPRYTQSEAALAEDTEKVREWCGKNPESSYAQAVFAVLGGPIKEAAAAASQSQPQDPGPTSCRVGPTAACSGCSVTCSGGKQATCKQGRDNLDGDACFFQSKCFCK